MDWDAITKAITAFFAFAPFKALAIIIGAVLLRIILQFVINRVVSRVVSGVKKKQNAEDTMALFASPLAAVRTVQRTRALGSVLNSAVTTAIIIVAGILLVTTASPESSSAFALITAALGAGLGFGAQNLVKDILNGIFMVVEDQLGVGDVVDLGTATGVVEAVGIRVTQVRDVNGTLWFVRNGEILRVGNMSQGWSRVIIDLAVPYEADIEAVQEKILATAKSLATDSKWKSRIIEKPEIWGIESISAEAIVVRLVIKTAPANKDDVARELRGRLKNALDEMGVRLPALNSIVLSGFEGAASVKGARPPKTAQIPVAPAPTTKKTRRDPRAISKLPKDPQ
jgi:small conductance mechanosensitive channel